MLGDSERDVLWKESRHEARQAVTGASVIPLFYPRGCAALAQAVTTSDSDPVPRMIALSGKMAHHHGDTVTASYGHNRLAAIRPGPVRGRLTVTRTIVPSPAGHGALRSCDVGCPA